MANLFFTTMITVVGVPYTSLGGELSSDYHERTAVFAYSQGFGMLGGLAGMAMLPLAGFAGVDSERTSPSRSRACALCLPALVLFIFTYFATREPAPKENASGRASLRSMLAANLRKPLLPSPGPFHGGGGELGDDAWAYSSFLSC